MKPLALTPADCQGKRWRVPADLSHRQHHPLIPLHAGELAKAAASMPLALLKLGAQWQLVAVCGQDMHHNLLIQQGKWLGNYQPQWLSSFPFDIVMVGDKGIATFDQDSGLLDATGQGEPFFTETGQATPAVSQRIDVLKATIGLQIATQKAITALQQAKLITPWPDTIRQAAGIQIEGLHMVDEKALAQLSDDAFLQLRKAQALAVAYGLNFSIQQSHLLQRLARLQGAAPSAPSAPLANKAEFDLEFLNKGGTISFGPH